MNRRKFLVVTLSSFTATHFEFLRGASQVDQFKFDPGPDIIQSPREARLWPEFREKLAAWRRQQRQALNYSDELYQRPDFEWTPRNFACCFLMLCDERFYNAATRKYRVKEWLDESRRDFGGFDSVVLWHAYPRIGLDDRNQFDFYRDQPDGLKGLRHVVHQLRREGVRTFIDYNPWDTGTRREGKPDMDLLCDFIQALDVDGIFLDTMEQGSSEFRAKLDAIRSGVVLEGEIALPIKRVADHHMAWAQWFNDSEVPGVVRNKWFERRHQLHHVARWNRDRTAEFQTAFMNGTGTMIWDNVFGSWVGYSEREKSILRSMLPIQRQFGALFSGENWTPLVPTTADGLYASLWEGQGVRLWTMVNRLNQDVHGGPDNVKLEAGEKFWDLVSGTQVARPQVAIRARGIGCLMATRHEKTGGGFRRFLNRQKQINKISNWDQSFPVHVQTRLKKAAPTRAYARADIPHEMVAIPGGQFRFKVKYRVRECGWYESTPDQIKNFSRMHSLTDQESSLLLKPYAIDLFPVTNAQFAAFLKASGFRPPQRENFLKHWSHGAPPKDLEDHPVVYVDLNDARAYAKWAGKRLPTEEEWQFAAQGADERKYPWGSEAPKPGDQYCNGYGAGTTPVKQYPAGRSPYGIYDLCGNTWEWTESERSDGITRFAILRGGTYYNARGSQWYMDGGPQEVSFGVKCLLSWPGLDRCATVGFRCVVDLEK